MTSVKQINKIANSYGLNLYTYSPGDGVTRYRFAEQFSGQTCYFSGNGLVTLLGRKEARLWLLGYADAIDRNRAAQVGYTVHDIA
jgi:hypothetical protein